MSIFNSEIHVTNGERYTSDVSDLDVGVGNHLIKLLDGLRESDASKYRAFHRFTERAISKKLFNATEQDPRRFIRTVRRRYFDKDGKTNQSNQNALPLVYFHRALGFDQTFGEETPTKDVARIHSESGAVVALVDEMPILATYIVYIVAWDNQTLDKMVSGLTSALLTSGRTIEYPTSILGVETMGEATLSPVNSTSWSDMSPASSDDRLLAYQMTLEVKGVYYQARCTQSQTMRIEIAEPTVIYSVDGDHDGR